MTLGERFLRWRATRGYGVHSPTAYRLLRNVVKPSPKFMYYGEEKLELQPDLNRKVARRARILLRLTAELQPASVWISADTPPVYAEAIRMAGGVVRIYDGALYPDKMAKADLIVAERFKLTKTILRKVMVPGKTLVGFDITPRYMSNVIGLMEGGVILEARKSIIAVNTRDKDTHLYIITPF